MTSPLKLLVGPPAAGKTTRLLQIAKDATQAGKRVWWVGLPSQRSYIYRRATESGALLGLEFLSSQQVYYRLLAHALKLKPLIKQTGRIAYVGEALLNIRRELPAPGEARLFTYAIAEAKRYGLSHRDIDSKIAGEDEETRRFREVFRVYEAIKGEQWDYDDFRSEALKLAQKLPSPLEPDLIIVDGFREIGPLELRLYQALAQHAELWLALPTIPPGETASEVLKPRASSQVSSYRAANPVAEARWVLRSLKRDLAQGLDPLKLAVILPEQENKAFLSLADEYGLPMMDEAPRALADSLAGRMLLDLLELPDYPTASKLLAIPELSPLAKAALNEGVAGLEAITVLAKSLGLSEVWQKWLALLEVPADEVAWAKSLVEAILPELRQDLSDALSWEKFQDYAGERAQEASRVAKGAQFRKWWAALLQETSLPQRPAGGIALLSAKLASGRRFQKAYLMHAVEGAYTIGEGEDYFIPEEQRQPLANVFDKLALPKRFLGRDSALFAELLGRADELIVSYPEADQGGPLIAEPELVGWQTPPRLPELPAGSRLELSSEQGYKAKREALDFGTINLQKLMRYDDCAFRYWAEEKIPAEEESPWWLKLLNDLRNYRKLNSARLEVLKENYPQAAVWLNLHADKLMQLNYGIPLPEDGDGPKAYIDAAGRSGSEVTLYRFSEPGRIGNATAAAEYINKRWNELWAAGYMLESYAGRIQRVNITVWPVLGEPIDTFEGGIGYLWRRITNRQEKAQQAYGRFAAGDASPKPGFRCRDCRVFDLCREGQR